MTSAGKLRRSTNQEIADAICHPIAAHSQPEHRAKHHGDRKRHGDASERHTEIECKSAGARFGHDGEADSLRRRQQPRTCELGARKPQRKQQCDGGKPQCHIHSVDPAV